ncbi:MAG: protein TolR [Cocleimonas sp.]
MSRRCKKRKVMAEMNVVPYIDVMLVLLVIFMVTAPMMQSGVQIDMPDANAKPLESSNDEPPLIININESGTISIEDKGESNEVESTNELSQKITGQLGKNGKRPVYISADNSIAYDIVLRAMVAAQQAGAKKIGLRADPEAN